MRGHIRTPPVSMCTNGEPGSGRAHAAALQPQANFAELFEPHARNIEVDSMAQHVLGEARHAAAAPPQHRIGLGRAITAYDVDWLFRSSFALHFPQQIDQLRIHAGGLAAPPVAQEPVEFLQRRLVIAAVTLVGEVMRSWVCTWCMRSCGCRHRRPRSAAPACEHHDEESEAARIAGLCSQESITFRARGTDGHWRSRVPALSVTVRRVPAANNANALLIWEG